MRTTLAVLLFPLAVGSPAAPAFVEVNVGLSGLRGHEVNWGDYDGDGDLDLAILGFDAGGNRFTRLYRNDAGTFVHDTNAVMLGLTEGPFVFGDYDRDGDLDIAFGGWSGGGTGNRIHRNDGAGGFTLLDAGLRGMKGADGAWFDYDNDGDLDLLLAGESYDPPQGDYAHIYRNAGGDQFPLGVSLPGMYLGAVSAGDYDRDGDYDVAITGRTVGTKVFRNDGGGTFVPLPAAFPAILNSVVAWGDYDNDGDLDLFVSGGDGNPLEGDLYRNDGGGVFTDMNAGIPNVRLGDADWGDYDNDGDLDLLLVGSDVAFNALAFVYENQAGTFVNAGLALQGVMNQSTGAWGDYDNDGDLDIVLAGQTVNNGTAVVKIYRNDSTVANTPPTAPAGLTASWSGNNLTLQWNASSDAQTPPAGLTYNLRIGTTPGGQDVMAPMSNTATGFRRVPARGNAQQNLSWTIKGLAAGTYYCAAQAVDGGYRGSAWSAELSAATPPVGPRVTSVTPTGTMTAGITQVKVLLDVAFDPVTVNSTSVTLVRAGGDGLLGTADDVEVYPLSITTANTEITMDFTGLPLPNDAYRIRVRGNEPAIASETNRWKLDDGAGATALDAVGSLDGALLGAPAWSAEGRLGGALEFSASDHRVLLGGADLPQPYTASMWVRRVDSPNEDARLMNSSTASFRLEQYNHTNRVGLTVPTVLDFAYNYTAPVGSWAHLAFVADGVQTALYVNGIYSQNNGGFAMGCPREYLGSNDFNSMRGRLDEVRLFSRRLTEAEIKRLAGLGGVVRGLTGAPLDGEFGGTFPTGDGVGGGDFVSDFTIAHPTPFFSLASPTPGSSGAAPSEVWMSSSTILDPATVGPASVRVVRAGADLSLGTIDDVVVTPTSVTLDSQVMIRIALPAGLPADDYQVTVFGTASEPAGAVNRWRFDEGLGTAANDSAGTAHGTLGAGRALPVWTTGRLGAGLRFDGYSERVLVNAAAIQTPWSASMWLRRGVTTAEDGRLMDSLATSLRTEQYNFSGKIGVTVYGSSDATYSFAAPVGPWTHLAFLGEGSGTSLYVNGVFSQKLGSVLELPRVAFGSTDYNSMVGTLDEVRTYNRKLTDPEIRLLASVGGAVRSPSGKLLDGEFSGSFPTGNGAPGGDFVMTFHVVASPGAFSLLAPSDGATGVSTTPAFSWSASSDATSYRIRVSQGPGFGPAFVIDQSGLVATSFTPGAALASGTAYLWDVTAVNGAGTRLAVGSISNFTTVGAAPGAFALISPADGATGLPLQPTFSWGASAGAASYTLQISMDAAFTLPVLHQGVPGTSVSSGIFLDPGRIYYWRVLAVNAALGTTLSTGAPRAFSTSADLRVGGDCGLTGWELFVLLAALRRLKPKSRRQADREAEGADGGVLG
jgi:hypothetical protein